MLVKIALTLTLFSAFTTSFCFAHPKSQKCSNLLKSLKKSQRDKETARTLKDYEERLFSELEQVASTPKDQLPAQSQLRLFLSSKNLPSFFKRLSKSLRRPTRWVDLGAGYGVPMRGINFLFEGKTSPVQTTAVDLVNWEINPSDHPSYAVAKKTTPKRMWLKKFKPLYRFEDITHIEFSEHEKPDFITSIESLQYVPDKLQLIANAYNQLADGGLLFLSIEDAWILGSIRGENDRISSKIEENAKRFLKTLYSAGIQFVIWLPERHDGPIATRNLLIQKKPGTRFSVATDLAGTSTSFYGYVVSFYEAPGPNLMITSESK